MTVDEILEEWKSDSKIDVMEVGQASIKTHELHHKYLTILTGENLKLKKLKYQYSSLYKTKWEYYLGQLDYDTIKEYGWEPIGLKILRQDVSIYLDSDKDLQDIKARISIVEEKISVLDSILKTIHTRGYHIKNYIDFERFKVGS